MLKQFSQLRPLNVSNRCWFYWFVLTPNYHPLDLGRQKDWDIISVCDNPFIEYHLCTYLAFLTLFTIHLVQTPVTFPLKRNGTNAYGSLTNHVDEKNPTFVTYELYGPTNKGSFWMTIRRENAFIHVRCNSIFHGNHNKYYIIPSSFQMSFFFGGVSVCFCWKYKKMSALKYVNREHHEYMNG